MCVLFRCFKMKVPRSPLPGRSLEQAWKASEAEGVQGLRRAGEHAAPERSEARAAAAAAGGASCPGWGLHRQGQPGARRSGQSAWPSGSTVSPSDSTRWEKGLMLSLNSTKVQSYNIWDFSSNANFYKFFFSFFYFFYFLLSSNFSSMI